MVSLVLGFILPAIVWVLLLPLKISMKIAQKSMKYGSKQLINSYRQVSNKEKNLLNNEKFNKTNKYMRMSIKAGYKLAKFGVWATFKTLKLVVTVIEVTMHFIVWLSSITSISYAVILTGSVASIIAVAVISINLAQQPKTQSTSDSSSSSSFTGQDFMSIDWSQDFTKQLNAINDKYGVEARNWAELSVVEMNTLQKALKDGKISMGESGFMTGIKAIESGQNSLISSPSVVTQEVGMGNPMQFDTGWQQYNPYYTSLSRSQSGVKSYYPDDFYGIGVRFNNSGVNGFIPDRTNAIYDKAFQSMGVSKTTDKLQFVRYVGDITNEYNSVFLEKTGYVSGLTKESADDTVYANAMLLIEFGEQYGYGISDKTIALVKSMYAHSKNDKYDNWFYDKSTAIKAIYGMVGGNKSYPDDVDKTTDFGVIDPSGSKVSGSLFNYLVSKMPDKAKNDMLNSSGLKVYNATSSYYMRGRYDLTAFLCGVYDVWWASNALGVQPSSSGSKGAVQDSNSTNTLGINQRIVELAKSYAGDTSSSRIQFGYTGEGNVQDSASFVNGILRELGYAVDGTSIPVRPITSGNLTYIRTTDQMLDSVKRRPDLLVSVGYKGRNIPVKILESSLEPGDILLSSDKDLKHTAIYIGQNSNGDYVLAESLTDDPQGFIAKSNMDLTGQSYGFGFTSLDASPNANKYNYIIRLSNSVK